MIPQTDARWKCKGCGDYLTRRQLLPSHSPHDGTRAHHRPGSDQVCGPAVRVDDAPKTDWLDQATGRVSDEPTSTTRLLGDIATLVREADELRDRGVLTKAGKTSWEPQTIRRILARELDPQRRERAAARAATRDHFSTPG